MKFTSFCVYIIFFILCAGVAIPNTLGATNVDIFFESQSIDENVFQREYIIHNTDIYARSIVIETTIFDNIFGGIVANIQDNVEIQAKEEKIFTQSFNSTPWFGWFTIQMNIYNEEDKNQSKTLSVPLQFFPMKEFALFLISTLLLLVYFLSRPNEFDISDWQYYKVKKHDTISSIAQSFHIHRKWLKRVNHIQSVTKDEEILVPPQKSK